MKAEPVHTLMATVNSINSGASPGQAAISGGPQELLKDIKDTKDELKTVKDEIEKLNKRLDDSDFTETGRYSSAEKVEAELKDLKAEKARLDDRLNMYETQKLAAQQQQQQQSGAGV